MNAVGKRDAAVVARTFEPAEMPANHVHAAKLARLDRITHPQRRRIKPQNMTDLQDPFVFLGELGKFFGFLVRERQRFFNEHVLAGFQKFLAERKMRLRGRDDDHAVHLGREVLVICREARVGQAELARGLELLRAHLGHVKLDGHRIEIAQMVGAPAAQTEQKDFCHRNLMVKTRGI